MTMCYEETVVVPSTSPTRSRIAAESAHSWSFFLASCQFKGTQRTLDAIADPTTRDAYGAARKVVGVLKLELEEGGAHPYS